MREKLKAYVQSLFRNAPDTPQNEELREEILQNSLDRFDDCIARGMTEKAAYTQAVSSIGDVSQLIEGGRPRKRRTGWIIGGCVAAAAVVALLAGAWSLLARPAKNPPHYRQEEANPSLGSGIAEIVDWAVDLGGEVADAAVNWGSGVSNITYSHADQYTAGPVELSGQTVREISISWLSGNVTVEAYGGSAVSVSETDQSNPDLQLHWRLDGGTLTIQPFSAGSHTNVPSKDLTVRIPAALAAGLQSLKVDTTSADALVSGLTLERLRFDAVSGSLTAQADCANLETDTTSGGINFTGTAGDVDMDTVSGSVSLVLTDTPDELSFDSTSGSIDLTLPAERSFRADLDTVSGSLNCAYETASREKDMLLYTGTDRRAPAELEFDTVSGSVNINR